MVELQNMGLRVRAPQLANKLLIVHLFIFVHILHAAYLHEKQRCTTGQSKEKDPGR